ncbi:MAG: glycosyltransferase family 4 protein [Candidatus Lutacidiplasmatales archaeon]
MRILEATQRFPPALGGVERHVERLSAELVRAGHSVIVSTTDLLRDRPFARLRDPEAPWTYSVHRHRSARILPDLALGTGIWAPGMGFEMLSSDVDVLHAHAFGYFPTWAAALTRRLRSLPLVVTPHSDAGRGKPGSRLYGRSVAWATLRRADRVVALTSLESTYLEGLGVDPARIVVLPNGIDLQEFAHPPARQGSPTGITVLFVGRLSPGQKGLESLVRALAQVPAELDVHVRLVGEDWGGAEQVREWAKRLDLAGRVQILGPVSRAALLQEYANADLFVLPSLFEPFGIVLLEAMAAGLPIVATRVGGIPEVVAEGRNASLVPPADPTALAEAIRTLASSERTRREFSTAGKELVQRFSWERLGPRFVALFEGVVHRARL